MFLFAMKLFENIIKVFVEKSSEKYFVKANLSSNDSLYDKRPTHQSLANELENKERFAP